MYLGQAEQLLESIFEAHRDNKVTYRFATLMHGPAGVGKTQLVKQAATKLGMAAINVRVGQLEPGDLVGIPRSKKRFKNEFVDGIFSKAESVKGFGKIVELIKGWKKLDNATESYMVYDLPNYLPHYLKDDQGNVVEKDGRKVLDIEGLGDMVQNRNELLEMFDGDLTRVKGAVIFLDEVNRVAGDDTKQAIFQLPEQYRIHTYSIPESCVIVGAANPSTNDYQVSEVDSDKAFMDRFLHFKIRPRLQDWLVWAEKAGIEPGITSFYNAQPEALFSDEGFFKLNVQPSPRSAQLLNTLLTEVELPKDDSIRKEVFMGVIGDKWGPMLDRHLKENLDKIPTGEEVIKNYPKFQSFVKKAVKQNRVDYVDQVVRNVYSFCSNVENWDLLETNLENLEKLIKDLRRDMRMTLVQQLVKVKVKGRALNDIIGLSDAIYETLKADSEAADQQE